jgi:RNA polymerase sigma-70 factor (ECF subfamily)
MLPKRRMPMADEDLESRISKINTAWTVLFKAHRGRSDDRQTALKDMVLRYYGASYRYLLAIVGDSDLATELAQQFAVRFLRGDFRRANPERGRFRDFLKTSLRHLAQDHWKTKRRPALSLGGPDRPGAKTCETEDLDRPFLDKWREELLARTWEALAQVQAATETPYHTVLLRKTGTDKLSAAALAAQLSAELGQHFSEEGIRQMLHRARKRFAELLVEEVAHSLETEDSDQIEQELIELDLLAYCKDALSRRGKPH